MGSGLAFLIAHFSDTYVFHFFRKLRIKKKGKKTYVFTKKHEGKKEVISDDYLKRFMKEGFDLKKILDN